MMSTLGHTHTHTHTHTPQKLDGSFSCFSGAVCTCYLVLIAAWFGECFKEHGSWYAVIKVPEDGDSFICAVTELWLGVGEGGENMWLGE